LEGVLLETLIASGVEAAKNVSALRAASPIGMAFDKTNPEALKWAKEHAGDLITSISEATREDIRSLVENAFEEQFDVDELSDLISNHVGDDERAELIARTESMRAANEGQQQLWDQAVEAGVLTGTEKQEWITTPDDRLCPICEPLDGQQVGLDEMFDADGEEIEGPPAHPNCRCTVGLAP
jgi:SPP1 gp7 family putative phage head morphogenesis protein